MKIKKKYQKEIIIGWILIGINSIWLINNLYWLYMYNFTGILWLFMIPNWILLLNAILSSIGIYLGNRVRRNSLSIFLGILFCICLILVGMSIQYLNLI